MDGATTKPYIIGNQANQPEMTVTIEFKPAGLYALTGIAQCELTDKTISFETVNPKLTKLLSVAVEKAESIYELVTNLDILLLENMYATYHPNFKLILQNVLDYAGNATTKKLSTEIHYSERQLNRIFKQHIGVSSKSFSRLIRINNAFRLIKKPTNSLTFISDVIGYHDLPHFIRDFTLVCGVTPQEYRNNMSNFYNNTKKF